MDTNEGASSARKKSAPPASTLLASDLPFSDEATNAVAWVTKSVSRRSISQAFSFEPLISRYP
jgi:hypothetical protein